jgi:hypothetical protein
VHSYLFAAFARARIQEHHEAAARLRLAAGPRSASKEPAAAAAHGVAGRRARLDSPSPSLSPLAPAWPALGKH